MINKLKLIQALANEFRTGNWDYETLCALEDRLVILGKTDGYAGILTAEQIRALLELEQKLGNIQSWAWLKMVAY